MEDTFLQEMSTTCLKNTYVTYDSLSYDLKKVGVKFCLEVWAQGDRVFGRFGTRLSEAVPTL